MTLIAKNIRWFRKQQQISQTEFASIFGITRASVGAYEEGRAEPKLELISRFAKYYNVDLNSFIDVDLSLAKDHNIQVNQKGVLEPSVKASKPSSTSSFIQEVLETTSSKISSEDQVGKTTNMIPKNTIDNKQIILYKSAREYQYIDQAQWPFFTGCDAVFECNPHLERDSLHFRDGMYFLCAQITQEGMYKGVFIEQDRSRLRLIEGDLDVINTEKKVWRVLYTLDSINSRLSR